MQTRLFFQAKSQEPKAKSFLRRHKLQRPRNIRL
jgi:hypothetical protein